MYYNPNIKMEIIPEIEPNRTEQEMIEILEWSKQILFESLSIKQLKERIEYCKEVLVLDWSKDKRAIMSYKCERKGVLITEKVERLMNPNYYNKNITFSIIVIPKDKQEEVKRIWEKASFYYFKAEVLRMSNNEIIDYIEKCKNRIREEKKWKEFEKQHQMDKLKVPLMKLSDELENG